MLAQHIPESVTATAATVLEERTPNFCPDCGGEIVLAGGADERVTGFYPHIDPVVLCSKCGNQYRHGAAFEQEKGHDHYANGITREQGDQLFGDYVGWCNLHTERMTATKSLIVDAAPARQYKCPECDLVATLLYTGAHDLFE